MKKEKKNRTFLMKVNKKGHGEKKLSAEYCVCIFTAHQARNNNTQS